MAGDRRNRHRARAAVGLAGRLLDGEAGPGEPEGALVAALDALGPAELLSFDVLARSWRIGLSRERIAAHPTLRALLSLVSADGHQRERGAREAELTPLTVRLLAIRSLDWVPQVATAALARLDACPVDRLAGALPVADRLVTERVRSDALAELLARRLTDDVLRRAATATDPLARRAAWRRLAGRHAVDAGEVAAGAADADVVVRTWALAASEGLEDQDRLRIARHMTGDASGVVAARALG